MHIVVILLIILTVILCVAVLTISAFKIEKDLVYVSNPDCQHCVEFAKEWKVLKTTKGVKTYSFTLDESKNLGIDIPYVPFIFKRSFNAFTKKKYEEYKGLKTSADILQWYKAD